MIQSTEKKLMIVLTTQAQLMFVSSRWPTLISNLMLIYFHYYILSSIFIHN